MVHGVVLSGGRRRLATLRVMPPARICCYQMSPFSRRRTRSFGRTLEFADQHRVIRNFRLWASTSVKLKLITERTQRTDRQAKNETRRRLSLA